MKANTNLDLTQATKLMAALSKVSSANIMIGNIKQYGGYSLYIKKNSVNKLTLLRITRITEDCGSKVLSSDAHYIII
jgi:hypothetical protein